MFKKDYKDNNNQIVYPDNQNKIANKVKVFSLRINLKKKGNIDFLQILIIREREI